MRGHVQAPRCRITDDRREDQREHQGTGPTSKDHARV
jgi:hypothetical protein